MLSNPSKLDTLTKETSMKRKTQLAHARALGTATRTDWEDGEGTNERGREAADNKAKENSDTIVPWNPREDKEGGMSTALNATEESNTEDWEMRWLAEWAPAHSTFCSGLLTILREAPEIPF